MQYRRFLISFLLLTAYGCTTTGDVVAFKQGQETTAITDEEQRLWHQAHKLDKSLSLSDQIYKDDVATVYLQAIMDKIYPEFNGRIKVHIVKDSGLNAFALPNGSIYMHIGMLARLENEAQVATVLAHEGAHFIDKHSLRNQRSVKNASAFAIGTAIVGIPFIGQIAALSSIYGYSRELETTADQIGYERLKETDYDLKESVRAFEHLAEEVKALEIDEPYFFSTHPKLEERIESFKALNKDNRKGGLVGREDYLAFTKHIRLDALQADLSLHRYKSIILALEDEQKQLHYPPEAVYFLGEAYRLRNEGDDKEQAIAALQHSILTSPGFAPPYRSLGLYHMKQGEPEKARQYLAAYLQLAPKAKDIAFIQQYYDSLAQQGAAQ